MPCLELKVAADLLPQAATRLRGLMEKAGAAVLRRNHVAEVAGYDDAEVRNRFRIVAVLAVDLNNPPKEPGNPSPAATAGEDQEQVSGEVQPESDPLVASFAKGIEIWISDGARAACVLADADEITGALAMFDAYLRLARYQPAFLRLDQRAVGLHYCFREGLVVGVQGAPSDAEPSPGVFFEAISPIAEVDDFRAPSFVVRLPNGCVGYFHDQLRAAAAWLDENSYPNILGSK